MADVLSAFTYYGGKARMAPLICDMLDYTHTTIYIEPFGGGARTLLNKPRHDYEIYNDASAGLCAFMRVMSDPVRSAELIDSLYNTEYSAEEFYNALAYRNSIEDNYIDEFKRLFNDYLKVLDSKYDIDDIRELRKSVSRSKSGNIDEGIYKHIYNNGCLSADERKTLNTLYTQLNDARKLFDKCRFEVVRPYILDGLEKRAEFVKGDASLSDDDRVKKIKRVEKEIKKYKELTYDELSDADKEYFRTHTTRELDAAIHEEFINNIGQSMEDVDEMKLARATYIIYSQSRDGMGKSWSNVKYRSTFDYHGQIGRLYDVAERLRGVEVHQEGALAFLLNTRYLNRKSVCFYLDPSYLKPEDEEKNLGGTYKFSSDYDAHELLLKTICNAKSRILISNYDLPLYNKYLTPARGWHKMEYETKTTVGGAKDNKRTEILWWNY